MDNNNENPKKTDKKSKTKKTKAEKFINKFTSPKKNSNKKSRNLDQFINAPNRLQYNNNNNQNFNEDK